MYIVSLAVALGVGFFPQKHLRCLGSRLAFFAARGARQKSRTSKEGRKKGRKERGKEGRKKARKEGTSTGGVESVEIVWKYFGNILGGSPLEGARPKRRTSVDGLASVEIVWGELGWRERAGSVGRAWMDCEALEIAWGELCWSEAGAPDERGWTVKRGNSLGGVPLDGARRERRTSVIDCEALEIAWGEFRWRERGGNAGRTWMDCEAWKKLGGPPLEGARRERREWTVKCGNSLGRARLDCE